MALRVVAFLRFDDLSVRLTQPGIHGNAGVILFRNSRGFIDKHIQMSQAEPW